MRGEEISSAKITHEAASRDDASMDDSEESVGRVFIAPKIKRKKLNKPWKRPNVTEEVLTPAKREEIEHDVARLCPVRFYAWEFCPLDMPIIQLFFPKKMRDVYHEMQLAKNSSNVTESDNIAQPIKTNETSLY